jgi:hypothetical protein
MLNASSLSKISDNHQSPEKEQPDSKPILGNMLAQLKNTTSQGQGV